MNLTTAYVHLAFRGEQHLWGLAHSALPNAPVIPEPERNPLHARIRRRVRKVARMFADTPSGTSQGDTAPAQG